MMPPVSTALAAPQSDCERALAKALSALAAKKRKGWRKAIICFATFASFRDQPPAGHWLSEKQMGDAWEARQRFGSAPVLWRFGLARGRPKTPEDWRTLTLVRG